MMTRGLLGRSGASDGVPVAQPESQAKVWALGLPEVLPSKIHPSFHLPRSAKPRGALRMAARTRTSPPKPRDSAIRTAK